MAYKEQSGPLSRFYHQVNSWVTNGKKKQDFVYAEGNADSYVVKGTAIAMAQNERGEAAVWTDGKNHRFHSKGTGMCMAGQGWTVAIVDQDNKAAAYSHQAYKNSRSLPSTGNRYAITDSSNSSNNSSGYNSKSYRCCGGADGCHCDHSCSCRCGDCFCS